MEVIVMSATVTRGCGCWAGGADPGEATVGRKGAGDVAQEHLHYTSFWLSLCGSVDPISSFVRSFILIQK